MFICAVINVQFSASQIVDESQFDLYYESDSIIFTMSWTSELLATCTRPEYLQVYCKCNMKRNYLLVWDKADLCNFET